MKTQKLKIDGLMLFKPDVYKDDRGYFLETYTKKKYKEYIENNNFIQDNLSYSSYGTIRGLHFQDEPYAQSKLVRCPYGKILDVAVDLRKNSPTYGEHIAVELSAENNCQLYIPKGFAHGFSVLSEKAIVEYKCDEYYNPQYDNGIIYNDTTLNIDWKVELSKVIVSEKDIKLKRFDKGE